MNIKQTVYVVQAVTMAVKGVEKESEHYVPHSYLKKPEAHTWWFGMTDFSCIVFVFINMKSISEKKALSASHIEIIAVSRKG